MLYVQNLVSWLVVCCCLAGWLVGWLVNEYKQSHITITSGVDEAFRLNVGEVSGPYKDLQLWRPCNAGDAAYEKGIGYGNEIFELASANWKRGTLRVKFGVNASFTECVDVCKVGDAACG